MGVNASLSHTRIQERCGKTRGGFRGRECAPLREILPTWLVDGWWLAPAFWEDAAEPHPKL
jgi:hypothetical protein